MPSTATPAELEVAARDLAHAARDLARIVRAEVAALTQEARTA